MYVEMTRKYHVCLNSCTTVVYFTVVLSDATALLPKLTLKYPAIIPYVTHDPNFSSFPLDAREQSLFYTISRLVEDAPSATRLTLQYTIRLLRV